jgi:hypothetical protein
LDLGGFENQQSEGTFGDRYRKPPGSTAADEALSGHNIVTALTYKIVTYRVIAVAVWIGAFKYVG